MAILTAGLIAGCTSGTDEFDRVAVSGSVTIDGAPVPYGLIFLDGTLNSQNQSVKSTIRVLDGQFTIPQQYGPQIGQNSIEITMFDAAPRTETGAGGRTEEIEGNLLGRWTGTTTVEAERPLIFDLKKSELDRR